MTYTIASSISSYLKLGIQLGTLGTIHSLVLDCTNAKNNDLVVIIERLASGHPITTLKLTGLDLGTDSSSIYTHLAKLSSLEKLHLENGYFKKKHGRGILIVLNGCTSLTSFTLESTNLEHSIDCFANACTSLTELSLAGCILGDTAGHNLYLIVSHNKVLTRLNLECTDIDDEATVQLARALSLKPTLTDLNLSYNKIKRDGAVAIGDMLKINTSLTRLNLGDNKLEGGLKHLGDGIAVNSTLRTLEISDVGIVDSTLALIGSFFSLESLDITYNKLSERGALIVSRLLKRNNTLTELNMSRHKFKRAGTHHILDAVRFNTTLKKLDISTSNDHNDINVRLASALVLQNTTLSHLDADSWPFTQYMSLNGSLELLGINGEVYEIPETQRNFMNNVKKNGTFTDLLVRDSRDFIPETPPTLKKEKMSSKRQRNQ